MTKKVMDALNTLNERLNDNVINQFKTLVELAGKTVIDVAEEFDLGENEADDYIKGSVLLLETAFKKE